MTPNIQIARKNILPSTQMKTKRRAKPKQTNKVDVIENKENEKVYDPLSMEYELEAGVSLIASFIKRSQIPRKSHDLADFESKLVNDLKSEYVGHWYPERPLKGSAFRCLRINQNGSGSLIEKAARCSGFEWVTNCLPKEFTIWIDPGEVSYRIGEEGSICVHYNEKLSSRTNKRCAIVAK